MLHRLMRSSKPVHVAPRAEDQASLPNADIPAEKASDQSRATPRADIPAKARARARTLLVTQVLALAQWTLQSNAPSTVLAFVYCLVWLFKFSDEALTRIYESEIYDKISRELSWILRHSGWTHADQSLTVFELGTSQREG